MALNWHQTYCLRGGIHKVSRMPQVGSHDMSSTVMVSPIHTSVTSWSQSSQSVIKFFPKETDVYTHKKNSTMPRADVFTA